MRENFSPTITMAELNRARDVSPNFSSFDRGYKFIGNTKMDRYFFVGSLVLFNCLYSIICKSRGWMSFAITMPVFIATILNIIFVCSEKKMIRINAKSHITFMENVHSWRNFSPMDHPRSPMCSKHPMLKTDSAIAIKSGWSPYPKPASTHGFWYERIFKPNLKWTSIVVGSVYSEFVGLVADCRKTFSDYSNNLTHGGSRVQIMKKFLFFFRPQIWRDHIHNYAFA